MPRHLLGTSLQDGTFAQQWGIDTPPEKLVGTGPYRIARYVPAQLIEYRRNPDYWMRDDAGKVTRSRSDLDFSGLKSDYAIGFRLHGPAATPLRIELAKSNEGFVIVFAAHAAF